VSAGGDAGPLLRRARAHRQWSQAELARRARLPVAMVCQIESGVLEPSTEMLTRLLAVAGLCREAMTDRAAQAEQAARRLEQVVGLASALPTRSAGRLAFPPFRTLVRR
jgi:transcriptional regulator with XRE-family HTH domain